MNATEYLRKHFHYRVNLGVVRMFRYYMLWAIENDVAYPEFPLERVNDNRNTRDLWSLMVMAYGDYGDEIESGWITERHACAEFLKLLELDSPCVANDEGK